MFSVLLFLSTPVPAIEVGWYPGVYLNPGDGVALNQQQEPMMPGLVMLSATTTNLNTGYQSEIITFAQNTYDMLKTISINSSVSLDYLVANGNIAVSFFGSQTFDANDLHFVFTKTRNFGTTLQSPLGFSSSFWNQVALYPNLQGEALHSILTSALGTHYVAGVEKATIVSVVYTFHYASASVKQRFSLSASGSAFDSASFSGYVSSFFGSTNTTTSMSYQFYSTDLTNQPPSFGTSGNITSYQGFTNFLNQLEAYGNAMNPANAKVTAYVLNPIQIVPGYLFLLRGYVPPPVEPADYSDFLQAYTALQVWKQRLDTRGTMSWLNAKGQQVISSNAVDVANYLTAMKNIALNHFTTGAPLYVPPDVVAYLANLSEIRLPEIYVMDSWRWYNWDSTGPGYAYYYHTLIGRVDCGNSDFMASSVPFAQVALTNGSTVSGATLYYIPSDFQTIMLKTYSSGSRNTHLKSLFASEQWNCLTNSNPDANGFFLYTVFEGINVASGKNSVGYSVAIYDPIAGTPLDEMPFLATRSGGCATPSQFSSGVSVSVASMPPPTNGVVGVAQPLAIQVTNQASSQAYGTTVSFALSNAFGFGSASGSQGYASFDLSNQTLSYTVGPMLPGTSAEIDLQLIPLRAGVAVPGTPPVITLPGGLTNSPTSVVPFSPIESALPTIGLTRTPAGVQLDWWSDTDRLVVEGTSALGSGASWSPVTPVANGTAINGSHRFLAPSVAGRQGYFRLHGQ